jgi:5-methylcytosine-specific restriction protein A
MARDEEKERQRIERAKVVRWKVLCGGAGCRVLVIPPATQCDEHAKASRAAAKEAKERYANKVADAAHYRNAYASLYGSQEWKRLRRWWMGEHPLCVACASAGLATLAEDLDHIQPHRGSREVFFDKGNLQGLCASCHSRKTAEEAKERKAAEPMEHECVAGRQEERIAEMRRRLGL